jgi:hypothetical protein
MCLVADHLVWEPEIKNQQRKGCNVWGDCVHDDGCQLKVWECRHWPHCIKAIPGITQEQFKANPMKYIHPGRFFGTDLIDKQDYSLGKSYA